MLMVGGHQPVVGAPGWSDVRSHAARLMPMRGEGTECMRN